MCVCVVCVCYQKGISLVYLDGGILVKYSLLIAGVSTGAQDPQVYPYTPVVSVFLALAQPTHSLTNKIEEEGKYEINFHITT